METVLEKSVTYNRSVIFSWFSTNKTDSQKITDILLKVVLNTINLYSEINVKKYYKHEDVLLT
jgi:hypothetical protein